MVRAYVLNYEWGKESVFISDVPNGDPIGRVSVRGASLPLTPSNGLASFFSANELAALLPKGIDIEFDRGAVQTDNIAEGIFLEFRNLAKIEGRPLHAVMKDLYVEINQITRTGIATPDADYLPSLRRALVQKRNIASR